MRCRDVNNYLLYQIQIALILFDHSCCTTATVMPNERRYEQHIPQCQCFYTHVLLVLSHEYIMASCRNFPHFFLQGWSSTPMFGAKVNANATSQVWCFWMEVLYKHKLFKSDGKQ